MSTDPEHEAADLVATEGNKPMSASELVAVMQRTETLASKDREHPPFAASLPSRRDPRSASDHSTLLSGRDGLTTRERNVLAMISEGLSNKRVARALEISPETVKSHVKRIFLKLAVSTRAEAVSRAGSLGLLPYGDPTPTASHGKCDGSAVVLYRRSIWTESQGSSGRGPSTSPTRRVEGPGSDACCCRPAGAATRLIGPRPPSTRHAIPHSGGRRKGEIAQPLSSTAPQSGDNQSYDHVARHHCCRRPSARFGVNCRSRDVGLRSTLRSLRGSPSLCGSAYEPCRPGSQRGELPLLSLKFL